MLEKHSHVFLLLPQIKHMYFEAFRLVSHLMRRRSFRVNVAIFSGQFYIDNLQENDHK